MVGARGGGATGEAGGFAPLPASGWARSGGAVRRTARGAPPQWRLLGADGGAEGHEARGARAARARACARRETLGDEVCDSDNGHQGPRACVLHAYVTQARTARQHLAGSGRARRAAACRPCARALSACALFLRRGSSGCHRARRCRRRHALASRAAPLTRYATHAAAQGHAPGRFFGTLRRARRGVRCQSERDSPGKRGDEMLTHASRRAPHHRLQRPARHVVARRGRSADVHRCAARSAHGVALAARLREREPCARTAAAVVTPQPRGRFPPLRRVSRARRRAARAPPARGEAAAGAPRRGSP
jgi:hypothetical protein